MAASRVVVAGAAPTGSVVGLRRSPIQARSSLRLEEILDAAAELSDEFGYDEVTTGLIANRAGVAIGTLYRFFDDKPAVYRSLSLRHFGLYLTRLESALDARPARIRRSWHGLVDLTVDCYVAMLRDVPGFRGFGDAIDVHLLDGERDNDTVLAERLLELVTTRLDIRPTAALQLALLVAVTAADALLALAFRRDPNGDAAVIAETKAVVRHYLAPYFEQEAG